VEVKYTREFVPLINDFKLTEAVLSAARTALGDISVRDDVESVTASEDFARLLQHIPGCFAFLGNGHSKPLHNSSYDFNDEALHSGVQFFVELARQRLPVVT
jgi:metal-dependent amidase/aminoacylase/carboxypeptidase family protein